MTDRTSPSAVELDVVVVTHRSAEHLPHALRALPADGHVVVVDNASDDASVEVARRAGATVVANRTNAGFGAAANQGAAMGRAPFVLFLNPDARIEPEAVHRLVGELVARPSLGAVGPRLRHPDGARQRARWPFPSSAETWRWALGGRRRRPLGHDHGGADGGFVVGACLLVRRTAFEEVGGFDVRYWLYAEEADLCRRLRDAGHEVDVVAEAEAVHVGGASGPPADPLVVDHFDRGTERFVREHEGVGGLLSHRAALLVGTTLRAAIERGEPRHRARRRALLRRLRRRPTDVPLDSPATAGPDALVVCSLEPWDETRRRNQLLLEQLLERAPHRRVLFVEPPHDRSHRWRAGRWGGRRRGLRPVTPDGRVLALQPVKDLPRVLGPAADRSLWRQVRRAAGRAGFDRPTLWVNDAAYAGLADEVGWPTVYDITDDWLESAGTPRARRRLAGAEARLFARAEAVVVCSDGLAESRHEERPDLHVIPNAVDGARFARPQDRPADLTVGRTAVYVGTLHEDRLDVDLVARLAAAAPDVHVVLVGPDALGAGSHRRLGSLANVHLLGPRPHEQVPAYLQHADVVVVPHVVTPFTESLDPIKGYECLAVGRPTVTTPVAGLRDLGPPIEVVRRDRWVDRVVRLARDPRPSRPQAVPSWADRAEAFDAVLGAARASGDDAAARRGERGGLRVLRVWHSGVVRTWRGRERALRRAGTEVVLVSARRWNEGGSDVRFEEGDDFAVPVATVGRHPYRFAYAPWALYRLLRHGRFDLIDLHEEPASLAAAEVLVLRWLARCRAPYLLYSAQNIEKRYPPPFRWFERRALRGAAGVHVCNAEAGRILRRKGLRGEVEVLGLGIDEGALTEPADPPAPAEVHAAATAAADGADAAAADAPRGVDPHRPTVAYVGRLEAYKGVLVLVDALARLPGVQLRMVGEGPVRDEVERRAEQLGVRDRIELVGFVDQDGLGEVYRSADVVAVPSVPNPRWTEQFGRVAVEAMAAGAPVVATWCGELPEVVGDAGVIVPPGDPVALAEVVAALLADPERRAELGRRGRERARRYTWPEVAASQLELYERVVVR